MLHTCHTLSVPLSLSLSLSLSHSDSSSHRQHPRLLLRVDAHCGPTTPPLVARCYSRRRGLAVAEELARHGVSFERVQVVGWGKSLAHAAAAAADQTGIQARIGVGWAELFVGWPEATVAPRPDARCEWAPRLQQKQIGAETEMPTRPAYYAAATARPPLIGQADTMSDGSAYSDDGEELWGVPGGGPGESGSESDEAPWERERLLRE